MDPSSERYADEIEHHADSKWPFDSWRVSESMIPWNMKEFKRILGLYFPGEESMRGLEVLDCGCGLGILSVFLAQRGAKVKACDISPQMVKIARRLAQENEVQDRVNVQQGALEELDYPEESFDLVVGTKVLHHVDIGYSAPRLNKIVKRGGTAVFWEPTYMNPVLRGLRALYRSIPGTKRVGSEYEHPLTRLEIDALRVAFGGNLRLHGAPFFFFSHIVKVLGVGKIAAIRMCANGTDYLIDRVLPFLRRWNFQQILVLKKEG